MKEFYQTNSRQSATSTNNQSSTNGTTNGNHRNVTRLELSVKLSWLILFSFFEISRVVNVVGLRLESVNLIGVTHLAIGRIDRESQR